MKIVEDEPDLQNQSKIGTEDDFANLIIPNKIVPSKLAKLKSKFVLNKNVSNSKKQENTEKLNSDGGGLIIPSPNSQPKITEYHNGVIIEEL